MNLHLATGTLKNAAREARTELHYNHTHNYGQVRHEYNNGAVMFLEVSRENRVIVYIGCELGELVTGDLRLAAQALAEATGGYRQ